MIRPLIEHGRLTLRLPDASDVPWIFHACQDPEIQRFTTVPSPYRADDAVGWVRYAAEQSAADQEYHFLVGLTETGELFGSCGLRRLASPPGRAEIGYWIDRDHRGLGVATDAVLAVETWAVRELAIVETVVRIAEPNLASIRVAEKSGYRLLGPAEQTCKGLPTLAFAKTVG
jgi:RimJ/RimL family protein N-acetyltransferase